VQPVRIGGFLRSAAESFVGDVPVKVLLVEDSPSTRRVLEEILGSEPGIDLVSAATGEEGLEAVTAQDIDVAVLDYDLPETTGLELLEPVRARDPSLAVVFLTGKGDEEIARQALSRGAYEYLVKDDETYDRLPEVLRRVHCEAPGELIQLAHEDRGGGGLEAVPWRLACGRSSGSSCACPCRRSSCTRPTARSCCPRTATRRRHARWPSSPAP